MREGVKHCKWYNDEFCTNGESPCVADYCPVVEYPELCKHRETGFAKDINALSKENTEIDVGMIEKSVLFDQEQNKEQYVWLLKGSIWKTYKLSKLLDLIHSLQGENKRLSEKEAALEVETNNQKAEIERLTREYERIAYNKQEYLEWVDGFLRTHTVMKDRGEAYKMFDREWMCNTFWAKIEGSLDYIIDLENQRRELQKQVDELKGENDIKPTEDYQHSENVPQEKCQIPPEMPDLLFIARMLGGRIDIIEKIKDGYAFGHAVGYEDGFKQFHQQLTKTLERINTEPIKLVDKGGVYEIKSNLDIAYNPQDAAMDMARYWNEKATALQDIAVFNPSLMDGKDKK